MLAVVKKAHERKVGARGLMMILEEILLEPMYALPSQKKIRELVVTKEMVEKKTTALEIITDVEEAA